MNKTEAKRRVANGVVDILVNTNSNEWLYAEFSQEDSELMIEAWDDLISMLRNRGRTLPLREYRRRHRVYDKE